MPCKLCVSRLRDLVDEKLESGVPLKKIRTWLLEQGFSVGLTTIFRHSRHYAQARETVRRIIERRRSCPEVEEELSLNLNILNELIERYLSSAISSSSYAIVLQKLLAERRLTLMTLAELKGRISAFKSNPPLAESLSGSLWNEVEAESRRVERSAAKAEQRS